MKIKSKILFSKPKSILFFLLLLVAGFLLYQKLLIPTQKTARSAKAVMTSAKEASYFLSIQDLQGALVKIQETKSHLSTTQANFAALNWTGSIPFFGQYYQDAGRMLRVALLGTEAGELGIQTLLPQAPALGLEGQGTLAAYSGKERIEKMLQITKVLTPQIDLLEDKLLSINQELDQINPDRYPSIIFGKNIHSQLKMVRNYAGQASVILPQAKPLITELPALMGDSQTKRYAIAYLDLHADEENNLLVYALFSIRRGQIIWRGNDNFIPVESADIKSVDNLLKKRMAYDGLIIFNPAGYASLMKILGPISITRYQYSAETDPRCNCPQVTLELQEYLQIPSAYSRRKNPNLFGHLTQTIFEKAIGLPPRLYWMRLGQALMKETIRGDLSLLLTDESQQSGYLALVDLVSSQTD